MIFLLVTGMNHANGAQLISTEWLSTNGKVGDERMDKWKVTVSFGPEDVEPQYRNWGCQNGATTPSNACYVALQGKACRRGPPVSMGSSLTPPTTEKGYLPVPYLERYGGTYSGILETCANPGSIFYGSFSALMHGFAERAPWIAFLLLSSHGEGGGTVPPIRPEPSPISCKIDAVKGEFDFGNKNVNELTGMESSLLVNIRCTGGEGKTGSGRLRLTSLTGENTVEMKNRDGDIIPVQLLVSKETGSNTLNFTAKDGYFVGHMLWAEILPFSISTYGAYRGSAVVNVTVD
ncbi:hypothetical protein BJP35_2285 [Enterobacter sp. J49]|nr:hypothetical protein BJP35_2285 [Enterobacter sp. J49]